jgi:DNA-directed RNA polymerase subunit RPC12/RpoP
MEEIKELPCIDCGNMIEETKFYNNNGRCKSCSEKP